MVVPGPGTVQEKVTMVVTLPCGLGLAPPRLSGVTVPSCLGPSRGRRLGVVASLSWGARLPSLPVPGPPGD